MILYCGAVYLSLQVKVAITLKIANEILKCDRSNHSKLLRRTSLWFMHYKAGRTLDSIARLLSIAFSHDDMRNKIWRIFLFVVNLTVYTLYLPNTDTFFWNWYVRGPSLKSFVNYK